MVWDRVGGVRVRGRGGGAEAAERAPTRRRAEATELGCPLSWTRPGRLEPAGDGAVLSPTAAAPGALRDPDEAGGAPGEAGGRLPGRAGAVPVRPHRARARGRRSLSRSSHTSVSAAVSPEGLLAWRRVYIVLMFVTTGFASVCGVCTSVPALSVHATGNGRRGTDPPPQSNWF
ncbi:hypothetical protein NN561_006509 [Cricetulus griseus]